MAKRQDGINVTAVARELGWSRNRVYRAMQNGTLSAVTVRSEQSTEQSEWSAKRSKAEVKSLPQNVLAAEARRRQERSTSDISQRIVTGMSEHGTEHGTMVDPDIVPLRRLALFPRRKTERPAAVADGWARRAGQLALGVPIVGTAIGVACLEMGADWAGVQAQIADPRWATILGGIAVAAGFFLFVLPTAFRFLDRRDFMQNLLGILFAALCFGAVVMSSSNGMLAAIADGVLAREDRGTELSKRLGAAADHLQVKLVSRDCGDSRKGSTFCNKTGKALGKADEALVNELVHIKDAADPQAQAGAQFGFTAIQVHSARVLPLIGVCLFVWIALTIGMDLVFPKKANRRQSAL